MRVAEVPWRGSRRSGTVAALLAGASLLVLPATPAVSAAPARGAAAKTVSCRAGTSAWKVNKRKVCLASKLRALPLPALTSSVAGLLRDVVFNDKLGQIARRRSRSRAVRRATSFEQARRLALGAGGAAAVIKAVESGTQRATGFGAARTAAHRPGDRRRLARAAADGITYGNPSFGPVSGQGSVPLAVAGPDGHPISVRIDFGLQPKSNDLATLGVDVSMEVPQKDGRTVAVRYAASIAGPGVPECPAADGTLTGSRTIKLLTTYTVKRKGRILSGPGTISYEVKADVHGLVGDNGLLDHADVTTDFDRHQDEQLGLGPASASAAQDIHASVGGTLDGAGLRAGAATPYTVGSFGASDTVTVGIKVPGLVNASADSRLTYATADELGRQGSELVKTLMTWLAKDLKKSEQHWYADEGCVTLTAGAAGDGDPGQVVPVTLSAVKAADGKEFKAGVAASGTASITPGSATHAPATSTDFNLTLPTERGSSGTWKLVATGKGGKKTASGTVKVRDVTDPPVLSGIIGGSATLDDGGSPIKIAWSGHVDLARRTTGSGPATVYDVTSVTFAALDYTEDTGSCLFMGRDTPAVTAGPAPGLAGVLVVEPGAAPTYRVGLKVTSGSINGVLDFCAPPSLDGTPHSFDLTGVLLMSSPTPQCSASRAGYGPVELMGSTQEYTWTWLLGDSLGAC